jgi:undecaprenyl pyrophosphate phosphatase UppP
MLLAIAIYFWLSTRLPPSSRSQPSKTFEIVIALVSLACINSTFFFKRKYVDKAEVLIEKTPDDVRVQKKWLTGYFAIYALSFAVTLYGMMLHFLGAPATHVVPFYVVGAALVLWFRPAIRRNAARL